ncbi:hypothetical protein [Scandinavium manionii]|uniref:hypothetical protein n=1 Tax=Scandinavium manionii TaxID=2926520 RepID=UPI00135A46E4|nr:hypothetical protein [Scandinavium manionii]MCS2148383.1 hypothetical protein [Scandinavium manionii]
MKEPASRRFFYTLSKIVNSLMYRVFSHLKAARIFVGRHWQARQTSLRLFRNIIKKHRENGA